MVILVLGPSLFYHSVTRHIISYHCSSIVIVACRIQYSQFSSCLFASSSIRLVCLHLDRRCVAFADNGTETWIAFPIGYLTLIIWGFLACISLLDPVKTPFLRTSSTSCPNWLDLALLQISPKEVAASRPLNAAASSKTRHQNASTPSRALFAPLASSAFEQIHI